MPLIYTHENKIIVESTKNLLASHGIASTLKNEYASGGLGELSAVDTWPEIWVDERDVDSAQQIIKSIHNQDEQDAWQCNECKEYNEPSFELCWNCQSEHKLVTS